MDRSIVIPKGTISSEKTTVVKIPVTTPANTTPLIVANRQISSSPASTTQEYNYTSARDSPQGYIPQENNSFFNQTLTGPNVYQGQENYNPCACQSNNGNANQPQNNSNLIAFCTDDFPEPDENILECECEVDEGDNEISESNEPPCYCHPYAACKQGATEYVLCPTNTENSFNATFTPNRGANSTFSPNGAVNSTFAPNRAANSTFAPNRAANSTFAPNRAANSTFAPNRAANSTFAPSGAVNTFAPNATFSFNGPGNVANSNMSPNTTYNNATGDDVLSCFCSPAAPCQSAENTQAANYSYQMNNESFGYSDPGFGSDNDEIDCFCSPQAPCKISDDQYSGYPNTPQANSTFGFPDLSFGSDSEDIECFCSPQAPCKTADNQYNDFLSTPQANSTFDGDEGDMECFCSPQAPCKTTDDQYNNYFSSPQANSTFSSDNEDTECFCSPQAPCKTADNQFVSQAPSIKKVCSDQYNDFADSPQNNLTYGYPDSSGEADCPCPPQSPCKVTNDPYNSFPYSPQANSTFVSPQGQSPNTFVGERTFNGLNTSAFSYGAEEKCECDDSKQQESSIICPVYLDSINEEDEEVDDNQLNPNMKVIHVTSSTYTRINDGLVQGKTFNFEDPERRGVSTTVLDQLAKSVFEEPPRTNQQSSMVDFSQGERDKQCKC